MESTLSTMANSPPLIPPPKSFLKRLSSLSLSKSSLSSKNSYQLHQLPPSPPHVLINQDHPPEVLPPTPPPNKDIPVRSGSPSIPALEQQPSSFSESQNHTQKDHKLAAGYNLTSHESETVAERNHAQEGHATQPPASTTPHLYAPVLSSQPPSPLPSYPPSIDSSSPCPSSPTENFKFPSPPTTPPPPHTTPGSINESSPNLLPLHPHESRGRAHSTSPSEVMGYLDEAIGDQAYSTSSYNLDYPEFSPALHFSSTSAESIQELSTSPTKESGKGINNEENEVFSYGKAHFVSEQHSGVSLSSGDMEISRVPESTDVTETAIETREGIHNTNSGAHYHRSESNKLEDDPFEVETHEFSQTPREHLKRKPSGSSRKVSVSKLQIETKTVRQQIKPGTVGELANLFTNMMEDNVTSPSAHGEFHFDVPDTSETRDIFDRNLEDHSPVTNNSKLSSSLHRVDIHSPTKRSNIISSSPREPQSTNTLKLSHDVQAIQTYPILQGSPSLPDPNTTPGLDFLSASREIFKQVIKNRTSSQTNLTKSENRSVDPETNSYILTSENRRPSLIASNSTSISKSNHRTTFLKLDSKQGYEIPDQNISAIGKHGVADTHKTANSVMNELDVSVHKDSQPSVNIPPESLHSIGKADIPAVAKTDRNFVDTSDQKLSRELLRHTVNKGGTSGDILKSPMDYPDSPSGFNFRSNNSPDNSNPRIFTHDDEISASVGEVSLSSMSRVGNDAESLQTLTNSENKNRSINVNTNGDFPVVDNHNTAGYTPINAHTYSQIEADINLFSQTSQIRARDQPVSSSKQDSDRHFEKLESRHSTSSSGLDNRNVWSNFDRHTNNEVAMSGDELNAVHPQGWADNYGSNSVEKSVSLTDAGISLTFDEDDVSNSGSGKYNENDSANKEGIEHEYAGIHDNSKRAVSPTGLANEVKRAEEYIHMQTEKKPESPLFGHSRHGSQTETPGHITVHEETRSESRNSDEEVKGSILPEFSTAADMFPKNTTKSDAGDATDSAQKPPDDFMSLLDDINIETDITSTFLRSSRRSGTYSTEKVLEHEVDYDSKTTSGDAIEGDAGHETTWRNNKGSGFVDASSTHSFVEVGTTDRVQGNIDDITIPESTVGILHSVPHSVEIQEEIRKQHDALSPKLSEVVEYDKSLNLDHRASRSNRSSLSSTYSAHEVGQSNLAKETLFDSQFFTNTTSLPSKDTLTSKADESAFSNGHLDINEKNLRPESDFIVASESPRLIPWSEYEDRSKIQFNVTENEITKVPDSDPEDRERSFGTLREVLVNDNKEHKTKIATLNSELLRMFDSGKDHTATHQESLMEATTVIRSFPWKKYHETITTDHLKSGEIDEIVNKANIQKTEATQSNVSSVQTNGERSHLDASFVSHDLLDRHNAVDNNDNVIDDSLIVATKSSREVPWSVYEEKSKIEFKESSVSDDHERLQRHLSFSSESSNSSRSSIGSKHIDVEQSRFNKENESSFTNELVGSENIHESTPRRDSLIVATERAQTVPWTMLTETSRTEFKELNEHPDLSRATSSESTDSMSSSSVTSGHSNGHEQPEVKVTSFSSGFFKEPEHSEITVRNHTVLDNIPGNIKATSSEIVQSSEISHENFHENDPIEGTLRTNYGDLVSLKQTKEANTGDVYKVQMPHENSLEVNESVEQKEDESHLFSKERFLDMRKVFEKQELENQAKPTHSSQAKTNSFRFGTSLPTTAPIISGSKNEKNREVSIHVGRNVSSRQETGEESLSRDVHQREGDFKLRETEIDTSEEEDSKCTDKSNESDSGSDVDIRRTQTKERKSKQANLSYDLSTGELLEGSVSRSSSIRSSSSTDSENSTSLKSSRAHIKPDNGHYLTETKAVVTTKTQDWTSETVRNRLFDNSDSLTDQVKPTSASGITSAVSVKDISKQFDGRESSEGKFELKTFRELLDERGVHSIFDQVTDRPISPGGESVSVHAQKDSLQEANSLKSSSSQSSFEIEDIRSPLPVSGDNSQFDIYRKTSIDRSYVRDTVRRLSSIESDKQDRLIDTFLRSGVGSKLQDSSSSQLGREDTAWSPDNTDSLDKRSSESIKDKISAFNEGKNVSVHSDNTTIQGKISTGYYSNITRDNPERKLLKSVSSDSSSSDSMTAVVGEVSSFSIHKKATSLEESFSEEHQVNSHIPSSRKDITHVDPDHTASDIYLIQDAKGDYYALQEVNDDHTETNQPGPSKVKLHVLESSKSDGRYDTLNGHASHGTTSDRDYYNSHITTTDMYVDSSGVEEDKAKEVISAFLDSQDLGRLSKGNNSTGAVHTFQESSTATNSHYSQRHSNDDKWGSSTGDDDARKLFTSNNPAVVTSDSHGSVVVQQHGHVTSDASYQSADYSGSRSHTSLHRQQHDGPHSSVVAYTDSPQALNEHGRFDHFNIDRDHVTNLNTSHRSIVDTAYESQRSRDYTTSPPSSSHPIGDITNQTRHHSVVNPFQPTPITITTTTQAVVGEQVGMHIDYSQTTAADNFSSTDDDDESNQKLYVVKTVPQKSSLKKTSRYDSSSLSDSGSDVVFTRGEALNYAENTRDIVHRGHDFSNSHTWTTNHTESLSPRTVIDGPLHSVHQPRSHQPRAFSPSNDRSYYNHDIQERSFSSPREHERNNLYRVRNLSTSVPDGLHHTEDRRKVSKSRNTTYNDTSNGVERSRRSQHHSPERFFKNPQLSLRRDDKEDKNYYSDEDGDNKQFRTVTKVFLNENQPRPGTRSLDTSYRVSSLHSQPSSEKKQDHAIQNGTRSYEIVSVKSSDKPKHGSPAFTYDTDSGDENQQPKYRIVGTSDNSHDKNTNSIPKFDRKRIQSHEEATITRIESLNPSRLSNEPPSTKTHKTVIQLDVGENSINAIRNVEEPDSHYMVKRAKSADDLTETKTTVNHLNHSSDERKMWTTGKPRSSDRHRSHSSSGADDSDPEHTNVYSTSGRLVKTLKQKDGNKMYVVSSTLSDPNATKETIAHSPGWYKSTIDINQNNHPNLEHTEQHVSQMLNQERSDSSNYRTEKSVYFVRKSVPQTHSGKVFQRAHSSEFVYPDSGQGTEIASSDGENEMRQKFERVERIYEIRSEPQLPEHVHSMEDLSNDLRVLRGNILIKNRLNDTDHDDNDFNENVNLFDNSFHLGKDNPLFSSDQDLLASLQREENQDISKHVHQDITFESVDKIAHEWSAERQVQTKSAPQRKKQNLSQLLLSKLANVDSKDIRQTIDVEHHNEEIYGDIDFIHADGQRKTSKNTRNFDSVNENVELTLTQGKAYVTIKVIAERIVPTDYEFNVWRKSQAIVTRQIEIDLLANEQRRRLYKHVMASAGNSGSLTDSLSHHYDSERLSAQERQLSSMETLKLFSQILDVTDGQGEKDFTETRTRQEMGQLPPSAMDLLY